MKTTVVLASHCTTVTPSVARDLHVQSKQQPAPATAGFTLIELLVSMTVVSLLATTILFSWRIATSAWEKANTHTQRSRSVLETNQVLTEQLASIVPYQAVTDTGNREWFFQG